MSEQQPEIEVLPANAFPTPAAHPPLVPPEMLTKLVGTIRRGLELDAAPHEREAAWQLWNQLEPMIPQLMPTAAPPSRPPEAAVPAHAAEVRVPLTPEQLRSLPPDALVGFFVDHLKSKLAPGTRLDVPRGFRVPIIGAK